MNAIQLKQRVEAESKEKSQQVLEKQENQKKIALYNGIAQKIIHIFSMTQGSVLFLNKLVGKMMDDNNVTGNFVTAGKLTLFKN